MLKPAWILNWTAALSDLLFPIECLSCGQEGAWLCLACQKSLPYKISRHCPHCGSATPWGETCAPCRRVKALDGALSLIPYAEPLAQNLIHAWKYQGIKSLSNELGNYMAAGLEIINQRLAKVRHQIQLGLARQDLLSYPLLPTLLLNKNTILIPVPLHKKKLRQRGFNQAYDLAQAISEKTGYPVLDIMERPKHTAAQATLHETDRFTNIQDAFRLKDKADDLVGKNILIVDDVITTGATIEQIAKILKTAGAQAIWALTIAYGHPLESKTG